MFAFCPTPGADIRFFAICQCGWLDFSTHAQFRFTGTVFSYIIQIWFIGSLIHILLQCRHVAYQIEDLKMKYHLVYNFLIRKFQHWFKVPSDRCCINPFSKIRSSQFDLLPPIRSNYGISLMIYNMITGFQIT